MQGFFKKIIVAILTLEARAVLRKYKPRVVAITGSVGKTSAKDAIYEVIAHSAHPSTGLGVRVRKSDKSFNSEIGLPLTVLGIPNAWRNPFRWLGNVFDGLSLVIMRGRYPEWLVLEVGADRPGDIRSVAEWLTVDIAVITRLPEVPVHVEYFDSPEEVVEEKAALISALRPGGTLVLFADDERYAGLAARSPGNVYTFGFSASAQVRGTEPVLVAGEDGMPSGIEADITYKNELAHVKVMGAVGPHALLPAIAACAVGVALGISLAECAAALRGYEAPRGRMRLLAGVKDSIIIDDTYNSSPAAALAALDTLGTFPKKGRRIVEDGGSAAQERGIPQGRRIVNDIGGAAQSGIPQGRRIVNDIEGAAQSGIPQGRRIAVLGDMLELGRHSVAEHRKLGARVAEVADALITVGFRARNIAEAALDQGMPEANILQFEDSDKAGEALAGMLGEGDSVLVKGSQSMRMERVVEDVMAEPKRAQDLLVRQEDEWKRR